MNSVTVDELVMRIEIELDKFRSEAGQAENIEKRLRGALKETEKAADGASDSIEGMGSEIGKSNAKMGSFGQTIVTVARGLASFIGVLAGSTAIQKFTSAISDANDQLGFLEKRLGMSARGIQGIETAVASLGGAGASARGTLIKLNQGIQEMVLMGNDSLMPFFSALGVGVVDSTGNLREMDSVLLDMADSLSKMDPKQAYALASAMGLDDGVANALIQGRDAMQEMLDLQKKVSVSSAEQIRASRELSRAQSFLNAQWEGFKTMLGNILIPLMTKLTKTVSGWMEYLSRNERTVRNFFEGISIAIGVMLLPMLLKAGVAMLALIAPVAGAAAVVAILAAAFGLLYDDYKTWAEGGESLFDWSAFKKYIEDTDISVESLGHGLAQLLTGYSSLSEAQEAFMGWLAKSGIIDQNGLSIKGLGEAFKGLGRDIMNAIPALKTMVEMIGAVMDGRWKDALSLAKSIPAQMAGTLLDASGAVAGRVAGAADAALGHNPGASGTLSSGIAGMFSSMKGMLGLSSGSGSGSGWTSEKAESVARVAAEIGMEPNDLAQIISFETGGTFNTNARNPKSSATGLIQKMADPDGKYYGYSRDDLGSMSFEDQMQNVVKRYFQDRGFSNGRTHSLADAYEAVAGSGYKKGSKAYELNKVWDANGDGIIEAGEQVNSSQFQAHGRDWMSSHRALSMQGSPSIGGVTPTSTQGGGVSVKIDNVNVQTSATTLPAATADGVGAGVARSSDLINQLGGGIQ